MLMSIVAILVVLWLLGFVVVHVGGGLIHLVLVLAAIIFLWNLIAGRRQV